MENQLGIRMHISAGYATGTNYINNNVHKHRAYEIFAITESETDFHIEGTIYHVKRGDILVINSEENHKFPNKDDMNFSRLTISFLPDIFDALSTPSTDIMHCFHSRNLGENNVIHLNHSELDEFLCNADKLIQLLHKQNTYGGDVLALSYMLKILIMLNQKFMSLDTSVSDSVPPSLKPIMDYIDKHLIDILSLESISQALNMSKVQVNRILKEHTGLTVHKLVNTRRITYAKTLIATGYSATEACFLSGFNDYTSFARIFKESTGYSPKEYKNR